MPGFLASMPGLRYEVEDVVADGDRVMAAYTLHTRVNERDVAVRGVMRFRVDGDAIAHRTDYWDSLVFQRQAGWRDPPATAARQQRHRRCTRSRSAR